MTTAFIWDESFGHAHDIGYQSFTFTDTSIPSDVEFENPRRLQLAYDIFSHTELLNKMPQYQVLKAEMPDLLRVHSEEMINKVIRASRQNDIIEVGESALAGPGSFESAQRSAGGAMKAVEVLFTEPDIEQSYAFIRPPGHHAGKDQSMGFCLFNNVAVAAEYSRKQYGTEKILIVDWDVHHGNGTQEIYYEDPNTCFISIHQEHNYPTTGGDISETGADRGKGYNVNIPLPPGCSDQEYCTVLEEIIGPIARSFQPALILLSAGQDANLYDPLGRMMVTRAGYRKMAQWLRRLASNVCHNKLAVIQEGGYSLPYAPIATLGLAEGLLDYTSPITFTIEEGKPSNHFSPPIDGIIQNVQAMFPHLFGLR
ncbi:class II histone deacetylase [Salicibibacter cibi]|uniref:Class II histone deacetylase n=1 Tax=Salicibibacter cibi TaxID=2743001 RepID=A0A7T7CFV1_9BACI|nr:class II histone deacetylase [Salicibibacter cibi]QQK80384.1 class II histone deacetylase [Salicibibacter cibi]